MASFIRRIFGKGEPDPLREWDGPFHAWCVSPRAVRTHDQHFVSRDRQADHDARRYVLHGLTAIHLLNGPDLILVSDELGNVLSRSCPSDLELLPADLLDEQSGRHLAGYSELRPLEQITREEILRLNDRRPRVWRYADGVAHLFVTKPVLRAIEEAHILGLHFDAGLSAFLGSAAAG
jgi:hypothetical protein